MDKSNRFTNRTSRLLGTQAVDDLKQATVAVFGLGGVGSFAAEAIARVGVGTIIITDFDIIDITNINRQLYALHSTIGQRKCEIAQNRILDINQECTVYSHNEYISSKTLMLYDNYRIDCAIDCIDSVDSKLDLIEYLNKRNIPVVTSMGAANKTDPLAIRIADIHKTHQCPLAKTIRKGLRERNIRHNITAVYSTEQPKKPSTPGPLGSIATIPSIFGLTCASAALTILLGGSAIDNR
ncbi:MAG: tRNA threonylcarbamoyladenosine dehydratase [Spirochaetes bacterium]|jgi:tRNA A37 threonylcarbamoyladenosine dehydratase|nr:tRNA threonylcarbamoyladenosine dehydratase [Spirochaetota bacterium]